MIDKFDKKKICEDAARFEEIGKLMLENRLCVCNPQKYFELWGERERIKNEYGGMPPEFILSQLEHNKKV